MSLRIHQHGTQIEGQSCHMYTRNEVLLSIESVSMRYGDLTVLDNINVQIRNLQCAQQTHTAGQVIAFLGPSGCGKTQLLRIIAGLQDATEGGVYMDPDRKPVKKGMSGVVFQKYPLFGHRSVLSNLVVAGQMAGMTDARAKEHAMELLTMFELDQSINKYPAELSGGMQQRVAISQQLMNMDGANQTYTRMMLMDEPFAALDPRNTLKTCNLIRKVADMHDTNTIIVVTHDLRAALMIGDIVWVMGRDRDANGKVCSGGKIIREIDLIDEGLTWHPDIEQLPAFGRIERELSAMFHTL